MSLRIVNISPRKNVVKYQTHRVVAPQNVVTDKVVTTENYTINEELLVIGRFEAAASPPRAGRPQMLASFARTVLRAFGWRVEFAEPPGPRGIIIVYPHTSNWDFVIGLLGKWAIGIPLRFVGKESLFRGFTGATLGRLMRLWGGRPVDRHRSSGAVEQLAQLMRSEPWFWLALSPEGTRKFRDHLRSGSTTLRWRRGCRSAWPSSTTDAGRSECATTCT